MSTLLVVTAGTTDLQVLVSVDGVAGRYSVGARENHEWLLNNVNRLDWVAAETTVALRSLPEGNLETDLASLTEADETRVMVLAAKLAPLVASWAAHPGTRPGRAIVFCTRRDANFPHGPTEPVAVGLLANWLERTDVAGISPATTCDVLQGMEDQKDLGVRWKLSDRIHAAMCEAREAGVKRVVISDTGGIPGTKELIELNAVMLFGQANVQIARTAGRPDAKRSQTRGAKHQARSVELLQKLPEVPAAGAFGKPELVETDSQQTPEAEARVRILVADLVDNGDFHAAHALASVPGVPVIPRDWAWNVRMADEVLVGYRRDTYEADEELWPFDDGRDLPAPLVAAFRAESALKRGAFPEAINRTLEFYEWSLFLSIEQWLNEKLAAFRMDDREPLQILPSLEIRNLAVGRRTSEIEGALKKFLPWAENVVNRRRNERVMGLRGGRNQEGLPMFSVRFEGDRPTTAQLITSGSLRAWTELLPKQIRSALSEFDSALGNKPTVEWPASPTEGVKGTLREQLPSPRDFRNAQSHNGMPLHAGYLNNVNFAVFSFQANNVWYKKEGDWRKTRKSQWLEPVWRQGVPHGGAFLAMPLVKNILSHVCHIDDPDQIYKKWVEAIRESVVS